MVAVYMSTSQLKDLRKLSLKCGKCLVKESLAK